MKNYNKRNAVAKEVKKMFEDESIFYVYEHINPKTREVVYVGHGVDGRAYEICKPCARRSYEHAEWAFNLLSQNYLPSDLVRIRAFGVSKKSAERIERDILRKYVETGTEHELFNKRFPKAR